MDDIIFKLSSDDPRFTHLDLRGMDVTTKELTAIVQILEKNTEIIQVSWKQEYCYDDTLKKRIENKVESNNRTFQRHPNDFVLGLFSCHVYNDSKKNSKVEFPPTSGVADVKAWNEELKNWTVFEVFDDPESSRYYSVAYLNEGKKQIVLAHRGTTQKFWDFFKRDSPLMTDLEGILGGKRVKQQWEAYVATKKVVKYAKKKGYNVSFTGHSLGAWLAELSVYFAVNDFDFQCKAVTFDSPGSASTVKSFKSNVKSPETNYTIGNLDITTYLSAPNLVNCCNPHIGKVYRIFPDITWISNTDNLRAIMKKIRLTDRIEPIVVGLLSINGHGIKQMVATFNSRTGKPKTFEKVLDWPCLKYQPIATNTTIGKIIQKTLTSFMSLLEFLPGVGWLAYEAFSNPTFFKLVKTIDDFFSGNIDCHEFWKAYESSEFIVKGGEETFLLTSKEQYVLRYEGHYLTRELNPFKDSYNRESNDWYLNKLCKLSTKEIDEMEIADRLKLELKNLKTKYKIKFEVGKKYICAKSRDVQVDGLRETINWLCEIYSELLEVFDDKYAFLPHDQPLSQSGKISSNLPLPSMYFLERPEVIKEIDRALNQYRFVAISAFSGTGKSTIAAEYGRALQKKFCGQIVRIIPADDPDKIQAEYERIARFDLGINILDKTNLIQSVHSEISSSRLSVLFIFDNVGEYEHVKDYLVGIYNLKNCRVIITTKRHNLSKNWEHLESIHLNPFTRDEAELYLKNSTGALFSPEDIKNLFDILGYESFVLPFSLSQALAYFNDQFESVTRFIENLAQSGDKTGTFLLLNLLENPPDLESWIALQYSAYLDPDFISADIYKELLGVDEDGLKVVIDRLESLGLMSLRRRENGKCGLKLHRLLQDLVKRYADANKHLESVLNKHNILKGVMTLIEQFFQHRMQLKDGGVLVLKDEDYLEYSAHLSKLSHIIISVDIPLCEKDKILNLMMKVRAFDDQVKLEMSMDKQNLDLYSVACKFYLEKRIWANESEQRDSIFYSINHHLALFEQLAHNQERLQSGLKEHLKKRSSMVKELYSKPKFEIDARFCFTSGIVSLLRRDSVGALQNLEEALLLRQSLHHGQYHHDVADSFFYLGAAYGLSGDTKKMNEYMKQSYLLASKTFEIFPSKCIKQHFEDVYPELIKGCVNREFILVRGSFDESVLKIKPKLQNKALIQVYEASLRGKWSSGLRQPLLNGVKGVSYYLDKNYLCKHLQVEWCSGSGTIEKARMLCFEAICLGIMAIESEYKNFTCAKKFAKTYPELIEKITNNHPEYFVDGSILRQCIKDQEILNRLLCDADIVTDPRVELCEASTSQTGKKVGRRGEKKTGTKKPKCRKQFNHFKLPIKKNISSKDVVFAVPVGRCFRVRTLSDAAYGK